MNVLIIGGSNELGIKLAKYFYNKGNNVAITYCKHNIMLDNINSFKLDICNQDNIENVFREYIKKYGSIDILVNMASIYMDNSFLNKTQDEFMQVLTTNLVGTFLTCQLFCRYNEHGLIVNVASTDGIDTGNSYNIDYAASKAGVISISRNMAINNSNKILCISPNYIDTASTRSMDSKFLNDELIRIGQSRLISISEFISSFDKIINSEIISGSNYRIDIRDDKLWVEKV